YYKEEIRSGKETILFVDDEDTIIEVGQQLLEILGYKVILTKSGKETIDVYQKKKGKIDLIILDMVMPEMSGGDTYDRLKEINPDVKVLLSSGYSLNGQAEEILKRGCKGFIQKPFSLEELSKRIREVLDE
ncbi:MAG: response regulator, partial [Deltaproteobacteria bacterium]|nr:response regulator [Deltaproteobacteria bacterium]